MYRDRYGFGIVEPGCTLEIFNTYENDGGMALPRDQDVIVYAQDNEWCQFMPVAEDNLKLPRAMLPAALHTIPEPLVVQVLLVRAASDVVAAVA